MDEHQIKKVITGVLSIDDQFYLNLESFLPPCTENAGLSLTDWLH